MRLIIEARLEGEGIDPTDAPIPLAVIDRHDDVLDQLGLSLTEGRELLAAAQSVLVSGHASSWVATQDYCHSCYTPLCHKDSRAIVMRTVFGKVAINSPRFWSCDCEKTSDCQSRTISPLSQAAQVRHARIGISPDQMGGPPTLCSCDGHAEGTLALGKQHLRERYPTPSTYHW